jgi:hypothetical protein
MTGRRQSNELICDNQPPTLERWFESTTKEKGANRLAPK